MDYNGVTCRVYKGIIGTIMGLHIGFIRGL